MTPDDAIKALLERNDVLGFLGAVIVAAIGWFVHQYVRAQGKTKDAGATVRKTTQVDDVLGQVNAMDKRLVKVEQRIEQMPTSAAFHAMDRQLARLDERVVGIEKTTARTDHAVARMENFLLDMGRKDK